MLHGKKTRCEARGGIEINEEISYYTLLLIFVASSL